MEPMADFLAVLGIVGFVAAMLGLIWALDRVWPRPRGSFSRCPSSCSCIWALPCSSPKSS